LFVTYDDGKIDEVGTTYLKQFFEHIESLAADAELGRAAVKAADDMDAEPYCITITDEWGTYGQVDCLEEQCCWNKFCRLRAGRGGE